MQTRDTDYNSKTHRELVQKRGCKVVESYEIVYLYSQYRQVFIALYLFFFFERYEYAKT